MEDVRWFKKLLSNLSDDVWRMGQVSRELQEYRKDIQFQWDDEAARDLNTRYSNPHEEDDKRMRQMFLVQKEALEGMYMKLVTVHETLLAVNELSTKMEHLLEFVQNEMARAYVNEELYKENFVLSKKQLPMVYEMIANANSMG